LQIIKQQLHAQLPKYNSRLFYIGTGVRHSWFTAK
jgi:hypothetical protein